MFKNKKSNVIKWGIVILALVVFSTTSFAKAIQESIKVTYNDIKLVVDGKPVPVDKSNEPFIYNGTTYVPVRTAGEALGKPVDWDGGSKTIYIGEKPGETKYLLEIIEPHLVGPFTDIYKLNDTKTFKIAGNEYKTGFTMGGNDTAGINCNLNSLYSSISFDYGPSNNSKGGEGIVNIFLDGKLHETLKITHDSGVQSYTIPVSGVNQLKIERDNWSNTQFGIGDLIIR